VEAFAASDVHHGVNFHPQVFPTHRLYNYRARARGSQRVQRPRSRECEFFLGIGDLHVTFIGFIASHRSTSTRTASKLFSFTVAAPPTG